MIDFFANLFTKTFKALSNKTRLEILDWFKDPLKHFDKPTAILSKNISEKGDVCVGDIQEKAGLSQSTISSYLAMLQDAGLLESERHGKWTYYRRNEEAIRKLADNIKKLLKRFFYIVFY
ncbi:ArsR family transcriptional regulator [Sporolactobacillus shoreae]|uniref:ArsR family transcriptional regulator n=1 Tax=Sporolactobacillus shoreae TaxID=1465501 RepID=A0A4Z0GQX4_9BACL|nr:metalloregulator ArsR/SmtB family transcription factor [Sporolactobacillus shoreae]TGA98974.1 ArsR family transcriptional regulator [Sporolactobacillus shoreae]